MYKKDYNNFVRPSPENKDSTTICSRSQLTGEEAKKIYLEEIKEVKVPVVSDTYEDQPCTRVKRRRKHTSNEIHLSDKEILVTAQNNDVDTLKRALDTYPDKINVRDEYGWSLLMIACQANSVETVKELLKRGIDTSIRDKAGNSAHSLIIKNKNLVLADLLLSNKHREKESQTSTTQKHVKLKLKEEYVCQTCSNQVFPDKVQHLSSTIHNINASKGRKLPANYVIPESNKGYQMMLKVGWDRDSGLGPDGLGKKYPIKTVPKMDRKGLGVVMKKEEAQEERLKNKHGKMVIKDYQKNKKMEINFRREFY